MSETLNYGDNKEAAIFYKRHTEEARRAERLQKELAPITDRQDERITEDMSVLRHPLKSFDLDRQSRRDALEYRVLSGLLSEAIDQRDANLWRAHEHKEALLDQYIETARQEAEAQGVAINLELPEVDQ